MRERIRSVVPKEQIRGLTVSTFHTFGLNLLRREAKTAGLKSGFSILDGEDTKSVLADLMQLTFGNQCSQKSFLVNLLLIQIHYHNSNLTHK